MIVKKVGLDDIQSSYRCIQMHSSFAEGLPASREWFSINLGKSVEGYHLLDGDKVVGHIYYSMSEGALVSYKVEFGIACIYCTWLQNTHLNKGYGKMMFDYMKRNLKSCNVKGIMIAATDFKEWMYYRLFLKQGFHVVEEHLPYKVMYFPLTKKEITVKMLALNYTPSKDKVEVTLFKNFFCPVSPLMYRRIEKVAKSFGGKVKIKKLDGTLENLKTYGTLEPLINGKIKLYGPTSEEDIMKAIEEEIFETSQLHSN